MTPDETLIGICQSTVPGVEFPSWAVTGAGGRMVGLVSRVPAGVPSFCLLQVVRASTVERLVEAGLITLGAEEVVPEYGDGRRGLVWVPGRVGRRFTVTEAGRVAAGVWMPL